MSHLIQVSGSSNLIWQDVIYIIIEDEIFALVVHVQTVIYDVHVFFHRFKRLHYSKISVYTVFQKWYQHISCVYTDGKWHIQRSVGHDRLWSDCRMSLQAMCLVFWDLEPWFIFIFFTQRAVAAFWVRSFIGGKCLECISVICYFSSMKTAVWIYEIAALVIHTFFGTVKYFPSCLWWEHFCVWCLLPGTKLPWTTSLYAHQLSSSFEVIGWAAREEEGRSASNSSVN